MPIRSDGEETRSRIMIAAGEVYGKNGFRKATNQEISAKSGANSAAVSYYFRDKAGLYRETWAYLQARSAEKYVSWIDRNRPEAELPLSGEECESEFARLQKLCRSLFDWMHDEECWDSEILRYEMCEATGVLGAPHQDAVVWPIRQELADSLSRLLRVDRDALQIVLAVQGIISNFRSAFLLDSADLSKWSDDECFETLYSSFLHSLKLDSIDSGCKPAVQESIEESAPVDIINTPQEKSDEPPAPKTARTVKKPSPAISHPELGVTDEVDPFVLKAPTKEDILLMKRAEELEKLAARHEAQKSLEPEKEEEEPEDLMQQELW